MSGLLRAERGVVWYGVVWSGKLDAVSFCTTTSSSLSHSDDICSRTAHKLKLQANWQAAVAVAVDVDVALLLSVLLPLRWCKWCRWFNVG